MFERTDHFIAGKWVLATGIEVIAPSAEQVIGRVPVATTGEVDAAVAAAHDALVNCPWPRLSLAERVTGMRWFVEAVAIANDSKYGLGGAVFATNPRTPSRWRQRSSLAPCRSTAARRRVAGGGGPFAGRRQSGSGAERAVKGLETFLEFTSVTLPAGYEPAAV